MEDVVVNADKKEPKQKFVVRTTTDLQRLKLEKLMKNPDKPVIIPDLHNEKDYKDTIPSFVRNVMGSSAGAGSGEFHVYRHLRRKEYARQKSIQQKCATEKLDQEYRDKIEMNDTISKAKTAKKRAKRLKRKQKQKVNAKKPKTGDDLEEENSADDNDSEESEDDKESETVEDPPVSDKVAIDDKETGDDEANKETLKDVNEHTAKENEETPKEIELKEVTEKIATEEIELKQIEEG